MATTDKPSLYEQLDFTGLVPDKERAAYDRYLQSAATDYEKSNKYQEFDFKPPLQESGYPTCVLVMGLPVAPKEKEAMIKALLLQKCLQPFKLHESYKTIEIEISEAGQTTGNAIIEFDSPETARLGQASLDKIELGKIKLSAITFDVLDDIMNADDSVKETFHKQDKELLSFVEDKFDREQIAVKVNRTENKMDFNEVKLFWNNDVEGYLSDASIIDDSKAFDGDFQCDKIEISATGKYVASFTTSGVTLFGGPDMNALASYRHTKAVEVKFSPDDTYMATFSGIGTEKGKTENMIVWNVRTGIKLKVFNCPTKKVFDLFSWSFDEQYCAAIVEGVSKPLLYTYNSSDMSLTEYDTIEDGKNKKKRGPLELEYPRNFKWANTRNTLCFVCYSDDNKDSKPRAGCVDIPSRLEYRWMDITVKITSEQIKWEETDRFVNIYLVTSLKKDVEHLLQVGVLPKSSAALASKPLIQVKSMSFKDKEKSVLESFGFDQGGRNFYITFKNKQKRNIFEYYSIAFDKSIIITKEDLIEGFDYTQVIFSNIDNLCLFHTKGELAFAQLKNTSEKFKLKQTGIVKTTAVSNKLTIAYDNSGRNVMVFDKSAMKLNIYSAYGQEKASVLLNNATQCLWRPIKRVPVDDATVTTLSKSLKKEVTDKFAKDDEARVIEYQNAHNKEKQVKTDQFMKIFNAGQKKWDETREQRVKMLGFDLENIENPEWLDFIDKEEEYDCINLGR